MKRALIAAMLVIGFASVAHAQTESPLVQEFGKKISGSYTIRNDTLKPVSLVIESYSITYDSAGQHYHPLDSSIHLQLSETSTRLSPQETHEISFRAKCDTYPCQLAFANELVIGHTQGDKDHPSVAICVILPEVVYACDKAKDCRKNILTQAGLIPLTAQK